jgi:hypothetical protein
MAATPCSSVARSRFWSGKNCALLDDDDRGDKTREDEEILDWLVVDLLGRDLGVTAQVSTETKAVLVDCKC